MGRIEREGASGLMKYIWYPGELKDWKRAAVSVGSGVGGGLLIGLMSQSAVWGVVVGACITAGISGFAFGQRDVKALAKFGTFRTIETPRALWRALVKGFGTTLAATLVVHVAESGLSSWLLPMVPALVAAIAHQCGMTKVQVDEQRAAAKEEKKNAEKDILQKALERRAKLEEQAKQSKEAAKATIKVQPADELGDDQVAVPSDAMAA